MNSELENDFKIQQSMLLVLLGERSLLGESDATVQLDQKILKVQDLVRSYQMLKWHEQEG